MSARILVEGTECDAHEHAVECAEAWRKNTGASIFFQEGKWTVIETDTDPEHFDDLAFIEEFSGFAVEVVK